LTKGYTETVQKDLVCEVSTWNYVINSSGFIEEQNNFMGYEPRELRLFHQDHSRLEEPIGFENFKVKKVHHYYERDLATREKRSVEERFWAKVNKNDSDCWEWQGAKTNDKYGYGLFNFLDHLVTAHKVAWILEDKEELGNSLLENVCGNRSCVKPDHWKKSVRTFNIDGKTRVSKYTCINDGCERPSTAIHKASLCEPCKQKVKRNRRKLGKQTNTSKTMSAFSSELSQHIISNPESIESIAIYPCKTQDCNWPSSSMFKSTFCEKCKVEGIESRNKQPHEKPFK
jgi:hypothetical protein